jgi:hypothetical protein
VQLPCFNRTGLYAHTLLSKIERETLDDPRAVSLIALIDYCYPQRHRVRGRRNLPLTLTLLKLVGTLNRTYQLEPIEAAEGILIRKKPAAGWTLFHKITLQGTADYTLVND